MYIITIFVSTVRVWVQVRELQSSVPESALSVRELKSVPESALSMRALRVERMVAETAGQMVDPKDLCKN